LLEIVAYEGIKQKDPLVRQLAYCVSEEWGTSLTGDATESQHSKATSGAKKKEKRKNRTIC